MARTMKDDAELYRGRVVSAQLAPDGVTYSDPRTRYVGPYRTRAAARGAVTREISQGRYHARKVLAEHSGVERARTVWEDVPK